MMNPLERVNLIFYYGAMINKNDFEILTKQLKIDQLYSSIMNAGLSFKDVGKIGSSWNYVIGKELKWEFEKNYVSYEIIDNELYLDGEKVDLVDRNEVKEKLISLNIFREPKFYIFTSWMEDEKIEISET